jgi:hypothetical protein
MFTTQPDPDVSLALWRLRASLRWLRILTKGANAQRV